MENTIKNFLILSVLCLSSVGLANAAPAKAGAAAQKQGFELPVDYKLEVPKVEYQGERYDFITWIANIDSLVKPVVESQFMILWNDSERLRNDPKAAAKMAVSLAEDRMAEIWDRLITKYPDSKNARVAFCVYGRQIGILHAGVKKCDKDFQLNPATQYAYDPTIKVKQAPKLK